MSECKKTCGNCAGRIESFIYKDRCDITQEVIEDMSATCDDWEADRETIINSLETNLVAAVSQLAKVNEERDELQAQVAVLRKGMEVIADTTSHKRAVQLAIRFVATTPSEAAERVQKLVEALEVICAEFNDTETDICTTIQAMHDKAQDALSEWRRDK